MSWEIDSGRVRKLPHWAQELIMRQRKTIDDLRQEIIRRDTHTLNPRTNALAEFVTGDRGVDREWMPTPYRRIGFELAPYHQIELEVERGPGGTLYLKASGVDLIKAAYGNVFLLGVD